MDIEMPGVIYGECTDHKVYINGYLLSPKKSQKVRNHSPDGFNWGYGGSGPAQLALAILLEFVDVPIALAFYQDFKWKYIASLTFQACFEIPIHEVKEFINEKLKWNMQKTEQ